MAPITIYKIWLNHIVIFKYPGKAKCQDTLFSRLNAFFKQHHCRCISASVSDFVKGAEMPLALPLRANTMALFDLILRAAAHRKAKATSKNLYRRQENIPQFPSLLHKFSGGCLSHRFLILFNTKHKVLHQKDKTSPYFASSPALPPLVGGQKVPTSAVLGRSARSLFRKLREKQYHLHQGKKVIEIRSKIGKLLSSPSWIDQMPFSFDM